MEPPTLTDLTKMVYARCLLDVFAAQNQGGDHLNSSIFNMESEEMLTYMLDRHTEMMCMELVLCLAPPYLRELALKPAQDLSTGDVVSILNKCCHLTGLSLEDCERVNVGTMVNLTRPQLTSLVTLNVAGCQAATDKHVQELLRTCSSLRHLSLENTEISDSAFLLHPALQNQLELMGQKRTCGEHGWQCQLRTVNVSGCEYFTNMGLLHLASLAGPFLHSLRAQQTQVDFYGLLYLMGHSKLSAKHFIHNCRHTVAANTTTSSYELETINHERVEKEGHERTLDLPQREDEQENDVEKTEEDHDGDLMRQQPGYWSELHQEVSETSKDSQSSSEWTDISFSRKDQGSDTQPAMSHQNTATETARSLQDSVTQSSKPQANNVAQLSLSPRNGVSQSSMSVQNSVTESSMSLQNSVHVSLSSMSLQNNVTESSVSPQNSVTQSSMPLQNSVTQSSVSPQNSVTQSSVLLQNSVTQSSLLLQNNVTQSSMSLQSNGKKSSIDSEDVEGSSQYKNTERSGHVKDSERLLCHVKDNERSGHDKDSERSDPNCNCEKLHHLKDIKGSYFREGDMSDHEDSERSAHLKDIERSGHLEESDRLGHPKDTERSRSGHDMDRQVSNERNSESLGPHKNNGKSCHCMGNGEPVCDSLQRDFCPKREEEASPHEESPPMESPPPDKSQANLPSLSLSSDPSSIGRGKASCTSHPASTYPALMFSGCRLRALSFSSNVRDSSCNHFPVQCFCVFLMACRDLKQLQLQWVVREYDGVAFSIYCQQLFRRILEVIGECGQFLEHLAIVQEDSEVNCLDDESVSGLLHRCTHLQSLDLSGHSDLTDMAFESLQNNRCLERLSLSPLPLTLMTPFFTLHPHPSQLMTLDLAWCEEVQEEQLNQALLLCPCLLTLRLRLCKVTNRTLRILSQYCTAIQSLDIAGAQELEDEAVVCLAHALHDLTTLDLSNNGGLTDDSVQALLLTCPRLKTANFSCLPRITSTAFVPMVTGGDWKEWIAMQRRAAGVASQSPNLTFRVSDVMHHKLYRSWPGLHRSSTYGRSLRHLDLSYCNNIDDHSMRAVLTVCRGGLQIIDYYKQRVTPYNIYQPSV